MSKLVSLVSGHVGSSFPSFWWVHMCVCETDRKTEKEREYTNNTTAFHRSGLTYSDHKNVVIIFGVYNPLHVWGNIFYRIIPLHYQILGTNVLMSYILFCLFIVKHCGLFFLYY